MCKPPQNTPQTLISPLSYNKLVVVRGNPTTKLHNKTLRQNFTWELPCFHCWFPLHLLMIEVAKVPVHPVIKSCLPIQ